jgi:hypothetical protein
VTKTGALRKKAATHRAKLRGVTMVIKSLIADPSVRKRSFRDRVAAPTEWVVWIWTSGPLVRVL